MSVADTTEGSDYVTVLFCIPNTPDWRQATTALLSNFTYGRAYQRETTNIIQAQSVGRKIFDTMTMCDLETQLTRIADTLESLDAKAAQLYTYTDFIDDLEEALGVGNVVVALVNGVFGLMPRLQAKVDFTPVVLAIWRYITWTAPILTIGASVVTELGVIAASMVTGKVVGIVDTVISGLGLLSTVGTTWKDIIVGDKNLWDDLLKPILFYFVSTGEGGQGGADPDGDTELRIVTRLYTDVFIEGDTLSVIVNNDCCPNCNKSSCECHPEVDGPVGQETPASVTDCCTPEGFDTFSEYEVYACQAANWIADKLAIATKQMELMYYRFYQDYNGLTEDARMSVTQVYQRVATALPQMIDPQLLFTIPNSDRADLITLLTDRYVAFQDAVIAEVPEVSTIQQVIDEYWTNPFGLPAQELEANFETDKQAYYDETSPTDLLGTIATALSTAASEAIGWSTDKVLDAMNILATQGLANLKFAKSTVIEAYEGFYECQGSLCGCPTYFLVFGTNTGGNSFASEDTGSRHQLRLYTFANGSEDYCGPEVTAVISNLVGHTEYSGGNDFQVLDQGNNPIWLDDNQWPDNTVGGQWTIQSSTPFTVDLNIEGVC